MSLVKNFDVSQNFWKIHPDLKYPEAFKALRTRDKSRDKEASSNWMWFIALCYDWKSTFIRMEESDRHVVVGKDFFSDEKFIDRIDFRSAIDAFNKFQDTPSKRQYREICKMMDDRTKFMHGTKYGPGTYKMLEEMLKNSDKIYESHDRIKALVDQEETSGVVKGGAHTSLIDELSQDEH
jgi:hypothetical protein